MLDEKDLQAIQSIIADAEQRITKNTVMMMETKFEKRFNLLAEGQSAILEFQSTHPARGATSPVRGS